VDFGVHNGQPKLVGAVDKAFLGRRAVAKLDFLQHFYHGEQFELGLDSEVLLALGAERDWDQRGQALRDMR